MDKRIKRQACWKHQYRVNILWKKGMQKHVRLLSFMICVFILFCGCSSETDGISKELGIDIPEGDTLTDIDTHGGFHGDGSTYIEMQFDKEAGSTLESRISGSQDWSALPLTKNLRTAVYGSSTHTSLVYSPEEGIPAIPEIKAGYYCFIDRHDESENTKDDTKLFSRFSWNFTLCIYDLNTGRLYYFRLDT